jgi:hypothetical protein
MQAIFSATIVHQVPKPLLAWDVNAVRALKIITALPANSMSNLSIRILSTTPLSTDPIIYTTE